MIRFYERIWDVAPELARLPRAKRSEIVNLVKQRVVKSPRYRIAIVSQVLALPAMYCIWYFGHRGIDKLWFMFAAVTCQRLVMFAAMRVMRRMAQWEIRTYLREQGELICIACGYDLRGSADGGRCPECGSLA